jgi:hypothetical protein
MQDALWPAEVARDSPTTRRMPAEPALMAIGRRGDEPDRPGDAGGRSRGFQSAEIAAISRE